MRIRVGMCRAGSEGGDGGKQCKRGRLPNGWQNGSLSYKKKNKVTYTSAVRTGATYNFMWTRLTFFEKAADGLEGQEVSAHW